MMRVICFSTDQTNVVGKVITTDKIYEVPDVFEVLWRLLEVETTTPITDTGDIIILEWWGSAEELEALVLERIPS